jgi:hypothetical protein
MFRSGRTHPAHAQSSGSETSLRIRFLAGYIIGTLESRFRKRQPSEAGLPTLTERSATAVTSDLNLRFESATAKPLDDARYMRSSHSLYACK